MAGTRRAISGGAARTAQALAAARSGMTSRVTGGNVSKRKTTRKKAAPKKATAKKATAKKATAKKAAAKKTTRKKAAPKKPAARKATRKKAAPTRPAKASPLLDEVEALAELMEKHGLLEVSYAMEADGTKELHVSRTGSGMVPALAPAAAAAPAAAPAPASAAPASAPAPASPAPASEEGLHAFASPMVGTFYRSPSPEAAAFVSVGDTVDPSSQVCIIEAMKVMNEITPDIAGEVVSIEVENGEAVEFGQTLMLIRPR